MKLIKRVFYITILQIIIPYCSFAGNGTPDITETVNKDSIIRFGIIADIQYCNCDRAGSRYYRNSLTKLDECIDKLNEEKVQFTINLGDLVDRDTPCNLDSVLSRLCKLNNTAYNLTGNHDYGNIQDNEQLYKRLNMPGQYYSFRRGNWCFIMLNTNEVAPYANVENTEKEAELTDMLQKIKEEKRSNGAGYNGGISKKQMQWLEQELKKSQRNSINTLIFSHHPLYGINGLTALNDLEIIDLLSKYSATVKGVISGHHHAGAFGFYKDIPFITVEGMVETEAINAYGIVTIYPDKVELKGTGRTKSRTILLNRN
ncbi:metallophosphoesterase [Bacteroides sp. UBA939]|uniref:metallophosphoesterase n=1 Tax=Bacteroides sp. UBA939 TaxID=1946092 RepID=UPI0025C66447|nr:metallophosphoesterase [Bacteroides sp. UBA939]